MVDEGGHVLTRMTTPKRRSDWLARGVLAAFAANVAMLLAFLTSFTVLRQLSRLSLPDSTPTNLFHSWVLSLLTNRAIELAATNVAATAALHLVLGLTFALVYATLFEPHRVGPAWLNGTFFALAPWALSLTVFFPLIGGGFLGWGFGAGPLPAIGNLVLHLLYGATLGTVYHALGRGRVPATPAPERAQPLVPPSARRAAREIGTGALVGATLAVAGALVQDASNTGLDLPTLTILGIAIVFGAAFGAAVASLGGIAPAPAGTGLQ